MSEQSDTQSIITAARAGVTPQIADATRGTETRAPFVLVPEGFEIKSLKEVVDEYLPAPERIKGTARMGSLESFIAHAQRFKRAGSVVFSDTTSKAPSLTAVYDYHGGPNAPQWCGHRATFAFPLSAAWREWIARDGKPMSQRDFAEFIEAHSAEIVDPKTPDVTDAVTALSLAGLTAASPTEMRSVSRSASLTITATVESAETLENGAVRALFDKKISGASNGATIPAAFIVGVPIFEGDEALSALPVRLRVRESDGKLQWTLALLGAADVLRAAMKDACADVAARTGLPVMEGAPE